MKLRRSLSLIGKMILVNILMLLPFTLVIFFLFSSTIRSERIETLDELNYLSDQIMVELNDIAYRCFSTSDAFSDNESLIKRVEKKYDDRVLKQAAILQISSRLFDSYNRLGDYERIDAIYVQPHGEVFDFLDPNQDEQLVAEKITDLGMNSPAKRGGFHWYPVQKNFLSTSQYGDIRRDNVIFGSRRVYSTLRSKYRYLHIFAVEENTLYEAYAHAANRLGTPVFVLNKDGDLLSCSDPEIVQTGTVPELVRQVLSQPKGPNEIYKIDGKSFYAVSRVSDVSDWTLLMLLPVGTLNRSVTHLYQGIIWTFLGCFASFGVCLLYLYRKFMEPLRQMAHSMKEVEGGNLQAYVEPCGEREMKDMLTRYNTMLKGLERSITQKLEMEKIKRELEMEVLTVQINPHFLYNTLETIVWKASAAGRPDIGRIATSLGKMYRLSIAGGRFVLLRQELDHLAAYAAIQSSRYGDKVSLAVDVRDVDPTQCWVLKLILQPIVENCYLYAGKDLDRRLKIRVRAYLVNGQLRLRITDNGIGMTRPELEKLREQMMSGKKSGPQSGHRRSTGIGLHNVYARLKLYQPKSTMRILSKPGLGTSVILTMPIDRPASESE